MSEWFSYVIHALRGLPVSRRVLIQENIALRSQLALFEHQVLSGKLPKPRTTPAFRQLWVVLSKRWADWR